MTSFPDTAGGEGNPREGVFPLLFNLLRDYYHFLAVKSGAKSGATTNFRGQTNKFPKTDAYALLLREKVSVF